MAAWLGGSAAAQPNAPLPPGVYRAGGAVKAPTLLYRREPEYTEEARKAKLQGTVLLSVVVGEDGQARDIRVSRPLGLGLDESAVAAVSQWKFSPGTMAGMPVAVATSIEVNFRLLLDAREWGLARASFSAPPGATQPVLVYAPYLPPSGSPEQAAVAVSFDVDEQGVPTNIHVDNSTDPKWDDEVIALIREWRFQAAIRNGIAVPSRGLIDFSRGGPFANPAPRPRQAGEAPLSAPMKKRM
jgi:TonB family protein